MITGTIDFNNITDAQLILIMQAKTSNEGKLFFNPTQVQASQTGNSVGLYNHVSVSWNEDVGFRAALVLAHRLLGVAETITKAV